jgi:hypothetical protein
MGQLVASGQLPYTDFFFAHPPLQIFLYAMVFKTLGFNLLVLKGLSAAAAAISGVFVFRILNEESELTAVGGTTVFLFTHAVLLFTSYPTGMSFVMMFAIMGYYYCRAEKSFRAGILLALGALTGYLALIPAAVIGGWQLVRSVHQGLRFATGFIVVFGTATIVLAALTKGAYIQQTLVYNLLKPEHFLDKGAVFGRMLAQNLLLLVPVAGIVFAEKKLRRDLLIPASIVMACAFAFTIMAIVFDYYMLLLAPFLALLAGYGLMGLATHFDLKPLVAYATISVIVLGASVFAVAEFRDNSAYDFEVAEQVAGYVREHSEPGDTIFGEDATTPLISLLSGREIALNYVDSNDLRFRTGVEDAAEVAAHLKEARVRFFLVRTLELGSDARIVYGLPSLQEFREFAQDQCSPAEAFSADWNGRTKLYTVYDCK